MTYQELKKYTDDQNATLVAVSKTKPISAIQNLYEKGQRVFGENRVQEMVVKHEELPKDIEWHMIGHLQKNKVKYMISFVSLIHSVDNLGLLKTIDKQAEKYNRTVDVLLQIKIASEASKSGWNYNDLKDKIMEGQLSSFRNIQIRGVMGMATFTDNKEQIKSEFKKLKTSYDDLNLMLQLESFDTISMGMSGDYELAINEGSNMVRIGSLLFGAR